MSQAFSIIGSHADPILRPGKAIQPARRFLGLNPNAASLHFSQIGSLRRSRKPGICEKCGLLLLVFSQNNLEQVVLNFSFKYCILSQVRPVSRDQIAERTTRYLPAKPARFAPSIAQLSGSGSTAMSTASGKRVRKYTAE